MAKRDGHGPRHLRRLPGAADRPRGPDGPRGRDVCPPLLTPPDSPYGVTAYEVLRARAAATVDTPEAEAPLADGRVQFTVRARFNTPIGPRTGDEPALDERRRAADHRRHAADQAWPGDRLRVTLTGANSSSPRASPRWTSGRVSRSNLSTFGT